MDLAADDLLIAAARSWVQQSRLRRSGAISHLLIGQFVDSWCAFILWFQVLNLDRIFWYPVLRYDDGLAMSKDELRDGGASGAGNITFSLSPGLAVF